MREVSLPLIRKELVKKKIERHFHKASSVFAKWQEDTPKILSDCVEHDLKYWKIHRFIKDPEEQLACIQVFREFFS